MMLVPIHKLFIQSVRKMKYIVVLLFLASVILSQQSPQCEELLLNNQHKIEDIKTRIVALGSSINPNELQALTNQIRVLEKENEMCQGIMGESSVDYTPGLVELPYAYKIWWSFVNILWWILGLNGVLSLLTMVKGDAMKTFNRVSEKTNYIYKQVMTTVLRSTDTEKPGLWRTLVRYLCLVGGILWSAMYPVLLIALTFYYTLQRTIVSFLVTMGIFTLVKVVIPQNASLAFFWYMWRCMEAISFFSIALMVSKPPNSPEQQKKE